MITCLKDLQINRAVSFAELKKNKIYISNRVRRKKIQTIIVLSSEAGLLDNLKWKNKLNSTGKINEKKLNKHVSISKLFYTL